jgi:hypothetical protein
MELNRKAVKTVIIELGTLSIGRTMPTKIRMVKNGRRSSFTVTNDKKIACV